jgi:hypothetical protein
MAGSMFELRRQTLAAKRAAQGGLQFHRGDTRSTRHFQNGTFDCEVNVISAAIGNCAITALMFRSVAAKLGKTLS